MGEEEPKSVEERIADSYIKAKSDRLKKAEPKEDTEEIPARPTQAELELLSVAINSKYEGMQVNEIRIDRYPKARDVYLVFEDSSLKLEHAMVFSSGTEMAESELEKRAAAGIYLRNALPNGDYLAIIMTDESKMEEVVILSSVAEVVDEGNPG